MANGYEDDMYDPTPADPIPQEEEVFPGYDPSKRYFWNGIDAWVEMKPDGGPDGDGCYNDHKGDKVCYDSANNPGSRPPDIGSTEVDPNPTPPPGPGPNDPCDDPRQRRNSSGECVDKPPCGNDRRGIPRVRNKEGKCVRDPDTTKNGTKNGNGTKTPEPYPEYGTHPDYPWDVDLGYLRGAPSFDFDYAPWVEPDAFTYAAYDQPDAFSYPEFAPPTGQQLLAEDPGYQFRLDEGRKALERSAAAQGTLRSGATLKGLMDYGQNTASQEYQRAYNRRLKEYQEGSGLAERAYDRNLRAGQWGYQTNLGAAQDQWAANRQAQFQGYGANRQNAYELARDQYAPGLASWNAEQAARERAAFAKYGRQWQAYTYGQPSETTFYQVGTGMEGGYRPPYGQRS